jgi:hypothetical protein
MSVTKSKSGGPKLSIVTGERLVRSSAIAAKLKSKSKSKSGGPAAEDENPQMNSLTTAITSASKSAMATAQIINAMVMSLENQNGRYYEDNDG